MRFNADIKKMLTHLLRVFDNSLDIRVVVIGIAGRITNRVELIQQPIRIVCRKRLGATFDMSGERVDTGAAKIQRICGIARIGNLFAHGRIDIYDAVGFVCQRSRFTVERPFVFRIIYLIQFEQSAACRLIIFTEVDIRLAKSCCKLQYAVSSDLSFTVERINLVNII